MRFRADEPTLARIEGLRGPGETRSDVLRHALEAVEVIRSREQMPTESLECVDDEDERAELRTIAHVLAALRTW